MMKEARRVDLWIGRSAAVAGIVYVALAGLPAVRHRCREGEVDMSRRAMSRLHSGALVVMAAAAVTITIVGVVLFVTTDATPAEPGAWAAPVRFGLFGRARPDDGRTGRLVLAMARSACLPRLAAES